MLLSQYKHLEVIDMPKPEVGDNDLLVEVRACGICGSDIHGWMVAAADAFRRWLWAMKQLGCRSRRCQRRGLQSR